MQTGLDHDIADRITFLTGSADYLKTIEKVPANKPFENKIVDFLNDVSREIMKDQRSKEYSDVVTFGFWIRKASVIGLKQRFDPKDNMIHIGKGVVFHIAPSNVPVNFAYSMVAGLLNGNANIVRVPSKEYPQVTIISEAINNALAHHDQMRPYIICVRYDRDKDINDHLSLVADMRIVWGGDRTIEELRKSPLQPRSGEITFSDRYSIALIDSDAYMDIDDKNRVAEDFYNDTFLSDQNACTSPRIIIWKGARIAEAKNLFWQKEHDLVREKYSFQSIQAVNKLTQSLLISTVQLGARIEEHSDNLIIRVNIPEITEGLMDYRDNSGYFYEYDCKDILEIRPLCNDKRCQTVSYIGSADMVKPLLETGVKGIDRIVPMGRTMDFDLIWDGYDLTTELTRTVVLE